MATLEIYHTHKTVIFNDNSPADPETLKCLCNHILNGYKVMIKSWCTGSTRVQWVVNRTLKDIKNNLPNIDLNIKGNDSKRYPEYEVYL